MVTLYINLKHNLFVLESFTNLGIKNIEIPN
jgi:hypothetical protein